MSLEKTKKQLIELLGNADNKVVALTGRWGTGKTHLWNEVKTESKDEKVKKALYVSLFGLSSIDQVKRKLIEGTLPDAAVGGGKLEVVKNLFKSGVPGAMRSDTRAQCWALLLLQMLLLLRSDPGER